MTTPHPLRILWIEDDPGDVDLIHEMLEAEGTICEVNRVDSEASLLLSLQQGEFDLILGDYTLPGFDGLSALKLARSACPDVPFIFVSGTLGEEVAIEALKIGATDYVLKTRLSRLVPSVKRALREAEEKAERKRAEEALLRSQTYLAEAQKLSHTGSFGWNVCSGDIFWSRETFRIFEFEPTSKVTIERIFERTHPEDRPAVQELIEHVSRERMEFDVEHRLLMPDGSVKHLRVIGSPSQEEGDCFEFVGAVTDITEAKRAHEALRRSEAYLVEAQRLTRSGSWAWNVRTGAIFWSQEMFRIYDYDPEKIKPTWSHLLEKVHPEDRAGVEQRAKIESTQERRGDSEGDYRVILPDGRIRHLHSIAHPVLSASGEITEVVGTTMDVTEQHQARAALRKLASLVENSTDFIGFASLEGEVLFVNGAGQGMVGLAGNEQVAETKIPDYIAEQNLQRFQSEVLPAVFRDGRWEGETIFRHFQTGASIPMWQHIFFITEEGSGRRLALATICRDITERKRSEERFQRAQAELAHVARLTTMGEIAASIAHEVNQPISGIVINGNACLRWLEGDSPNLDEAREAARRIVRDGKRAGDVIARIRALATKTATAKGQMDMNEAIRAVMDLARDELFRNRVTLRTEFADDLLPVLGDRVQLQQVILNLVMNGVEAMSTVGERRRELVIRTQNDETDHVRVTVRDSGIGLDLQSKERIFDAFYTTKSEGMGMGLSISRSIVQSHGGRLWAVANDGPGTTFQFTVEKYHVAARRSVAEG